eukprot:gene29274-38786_t
MFNQDDRVHREICFCDHSITGSDLWRICDDLRGKCFSLQHWLEDGLPSWQYTIT